MACPADPSARNTWPVGTEAAAGVDHGREEGQHEQRLTQRPYHRQGIREHGHDNDTKSADSFPPASPIAALAPHRRAVDEDGFVMPTGERDGGVITRMTPSRVKLSSDCGGSIHETGGVGKKEHGQRHLWSLVKTLTVLAAIATAVMLYITQVRWAFRYIASRLIRSCPTMLTATSPLEYHIAPVGRQAISTTQP